MLIPEISNPENIFFINDVKFCLKTQTVTYLNRVKKLSRKEWVLLKIFLEYQGQVITVGRLEQKLYGDHWDKINSNAVTVYIHNLRRKFPELRIKSIRGEGYVLEDSDRNRSN